MRARIHKIREEIRRRLVPADSLNTSSCIEAETKHLIGKVLNNQIQSLGLLDNIQQAEYKVYSQFGDDGIIQYLVKNTKVKNKIFIEFGVENYLEANTRFLLINDNWTGLVMDSNRNNIEFIKKDNIYWKYDLTARQAFITRDNINSLITENGFVGEIGLLSIDIDGNDYWIWDCINVVMPVIVVVEYNSEFGCEHAVTIPYNPRFERTKAHYSNLYFGASLKALCQLADKKGYYFVGSNSSGCNAYFVRKENIGLLNPLQPEAGYVESKFRQARDNQGNLNFISKVERLNLLRDLEVINLEKDMKVLLREII
jgi:hypothetical protein